jgi:response regulator RpfG family c-di-GMP phosphodiesterase
MPPSVDKTANSIILVVSSDPKFLKFLDMSLKLEFEYTILSLTNGKRAFDLSLHVKPVLFIIDYHLLDLSALELSIRLHNIIELECVPTIVVNSPVTSWSKPQPYNTTFLPIQFALEDLYAAVNENLGHNQGNLIVKKP